MVNMFSQFLIKEMPRNFEDCYANDQIIDNLWQWAKILETIGKILAIIIAIAAFIMSIVMFEDSDGVSIIICNFAAVIVAFLTYVSFHLSALLVGSLASIVQHTKITANINLLTYAQQNNIVIEKMETKSEEMKVETKNKEIKVEIECDKLRKKCCPNCGKIQPISNKECYNCETKFED